MSVKEKEVSGGGCPNTCPQCEQQCNRLGLDHGTHRCNSGHTW
jgi:hypothetical protein